MLHVFPHLCTKFFTYSKYLLSGHLTKTASTGTPKYSRYTGRNRLPSGKYFLHILPPNLSSKSGETVNTGSTCDNFLLTMRYNRTVGSSRNIKHGEKKHGVKLVSCIATERTHISVFKESDYIILQ